MCKECNLFFEIDHSYKHFDEPIKEVTEILKCKVCGSPLIRAYITVPNITKWNGLSCEQRGEMIKQRATNDFNKNVKEIKIEQEKRAISNFEKKLQP